MLTFFSIAVIGTLGYCLYREGKTQLAHVEREMIRQLALYRDQMGDHGTRLERFAQEFGAASIEMQAGQLHLAQSLNNLEQRTATIQNALDSCAGKTSQYETAQRQAVHNLETGLLRIETGLLGLAKSVEQTHTQSAALGNSLATSSEQWQNWMRLNSRDGIIQPLSDIQAQVRQLQTSCVQLQSEMANNGSALGSTRQQVNTIHNLVALTRDEQKAPKTALLLEVRNLEMEAERTQQRVNYQELRNFIEKSTPHKQLVKAVAFIHCNMKQEYQHQGIVSALQRSGFQVQYVVDHVDNRMLHYANALLSTHSIDHLVLISGDKAFTGMLCDCQRHAVTTEIVYLQNKTKSGLSNDLQNAVDSVTLLTPQTKDPITQKPVLAQLDANAAASGNQRSRHIVALAK